ncbi:hypothetical protein AAHA92_14006 [Salvia divinorum]|uniref:DUF7950 domain-containing protein n=1 Tax=Salvia divinorum TaxID=28513 RepID=A0ABD1HA47_SALDI
MAGCVLAYCTCRALIGPSPLHQSHASFNFLYCEHLCFPKLGHSFRIAGSMRACPPRSTDNQTSLNRIMLRFRPIAPKPAGEEVGSGAAEQNRRDLTGKRVKRKYVRIRARQSKRCPKSKGLEGGNLPSPPERSGVDDAPPPEERAVTLQLLGEREICEIRVPESKEMMLRDQDRCSAATAADLSGYGSVMVTWIVMEGVTDRFAGIGLGSSDEEKMYNLERETCPGFISDDRNNVIWVNPAYKKMVAEDDAAADKGFLVRLVNGICWICMEIGRQYRPQFRFLDWLRNNISRRLMVDLVCRRPMPTIQSCKSKL